MSATAQELAVTYQQPGFLDAFLRDKRALVSLAWLLGLAVLGLLAPLITPYSPTAQNLNDILLPPDLSHFLGTDDLGRDVSTRLLYGAPLALYASALATGVALLVGLPMGLVAGFLGGWVDRVISRLIDTVLSFPSIVLAVGITGALGTGLIHGMIAVGLVFSPVLARLVRAQTLIVRNELLIDACRCFGASTGRSSAATSYQRDAAGDRAGGPAVSLLATGGGEPELPRSRRTAT